MLKIKVIVKKYEQFQERYGDDAPVKMLMWLRRAELQYDDGAQALIAVIKDYLVERCVLVFEAETPAEKADEYGRTNADIERVIRNGAFLARISEHIGEI